MASINHKDSIVKSYVYPEVNIPLKVKRGYLTPPKNAAHLSTGTYQYTAYPNRVEHKVLAALGNPEGGWAIDGVKRASFYRVWLSNGSSVHMLGDLTRTLDGVYTYKKESVPKELQMYHTTIISLENNRAASHPSKTIVLVGKMDDRTSYNIS